MHVFAIVIVLIIIVVGVFILTRRLPPAPPPLGPCQQNSDCPAPRVCVKGACVDPALPGLIQAAQAPAQALYSWLHYYSQAFATQYLQHATALQAAAAAMGLSKPPIGGLQAAIAAGSAELAKYLRFLAAPGCDPTKTTTCGYYAQMAAMTPATPAGVILAIASSAPSAAAELPVALGAFPPVQAGLATLVSAVTADAEARRKKLNAHTQAWILVVEGDGAMLSYAAFLLPSQAALLRQTGYALYSHMLA